MRNAWKRLIPCVILLASLAMGPASCALYRNDRCWVEDEQYKLARDLYVETGSLELVRLRLEESQWKRCKINEVVYRLQQEFRVLPEELPAEPTGQPAAAEPVQAP
jgi:hypothetical protein